LTPSNEENAGTEANGSADDPFGMACPECNTALRDDAPFCPHCGSKAPERGWPDIDELETPWLGEVLNGRYRLNRRIGHGASGLVFEAESLSIARDFAVKIIDFSDTGRDDDATRAEARFEREVETLGRLRNPHIVSVYELLRPKNEVVAIVMDLVSGRTVREAVAEDGPMDAEVVADLVSQVANGLHEAHELRIVHRDIKPANIIIESLPAGGHFAHILDFGVVYQAGEQSDLTQGFVGTPLFASPEQARGREIDARSDIYSLGATAFFMLTGRPPFVAETAFDALRAHINQSAPRLSSVCDIPVPPELDELMASILSKNPDRRPDSLTQLIEQLERLAGPVPTGGYPVTDTSAEPAITQESTGEAEDLIAEERSDAAPGSSSRPTSGVVRPQQVGESPPDETLDTFDGQAHASEQGPDDAAHDNAVGLQEFESKLPVGNSVVDVALEGTRLALLDINGVVHVADSEDGLNRKITVNGGLSPTAVAISEDAVYLGDGQGRVHRCDFASGNVELFFESPKPTPVTSLAKSPTGARLVVGFSSGDVIYFDEALAGDGDAYQLHSDIPVSTVALFRDMGGFAVCRSDKSVSLHSVDRPSRPVAEFRTSEVVDDATFSGDAHLMAVSEEGGTLEIYHADTGHQLLPQTALRTHPMTLNFDDDDRLSAMCEIDGSVYRWDLQERFLETEVDTGSHTVEP
jgi:serine/threonine protein kinase